MATKEVGNLRTKLSWEDQGASRSLEGFRQDLKGLRSEMNMAKSKGVEYANSLKGLREQSDILTRRFKTQEEQVKELRKRYDESVKAKGEDDKATKNLLAKYNDAVATMNRTENQLKKVTDRIEEQINPWKRLAKEAGDAGAKMQSVGRGMTEFGQNYSMRVTAPIVAGSAAVFKASMDFESAFAGVEKTVDATEQQIASLRTGIRDIAKEIPASTTEIAAVAEAAGQLGIQTEKIEEFTRTMINLGEATNMTSDQAATEFARFANIVGMSQDDFDKLGSTIVALGNNLATTESEISEMSLRLAGAGAQVGLTESQILAFAGALSSVGIEAEAGGSAFSKVMVEMQLAAEKGGDSLESFAKVAGMSSNDFKKAYEQDATGAILAFIKGLSTAEDRGLSAIGILDEMGIKEVRLRDTLLRAAGATDVFSDAINIGSKAWEENTALTEEAEKRYATTESQLKILWNRVKDVAITLGDSLAPALMDAIDAAEPLIKQIESGAQAFADMDEEQQRTIMKLIAMAAAIGPVSIGIGGIASATGGLLKGLSSLSSLLGKAGGAGLLGRFAGLGTMGPVGLAIAGVSGLVLVLNSLSENSKELLDVNYDLIGSVNEEIKSMNDLTDRFSDLHGKNKLTTDEMLRYMDIMDELKNAKSEQAIKVLSTEQETLLEKSTLTNQEMEEFIGLNNDIIENTPNVTSAISDQGNAYIDNLNVLKEINSEKRKELLLSAERELEKALQNETQLLKNEKGLIKDISDTQTEIDDTYKARLDRMRELKAEEINQKKKNEEIKQLKEDMKSLDGDALTNAESRLKWLEGEKAVQDTLVETIIDEKRQLDKTYDKLLDKLKTKNDDLETTREEITEINNLKDDYEELILAQAGITSEKGRGLEKIDLEIRKLQNQKRELDELRKKNEIDNLEYEEKNGLIDEQIEKLKNAKSELQDMNKIAGKTVYKDLIINGLPSKEYWETMNRELGKDITKNIRLQTNKGIYSDLGYSLPGYADGTSSHPGGEFIAGEEGFELGRLGNRWELLGLGMYSRPAGYQVFPHDESKKILQAINRIPAYATGARPSGEADRVIDQMNGRQSYQGEVVIYTTVINQMNGRELSREIHKDVTEFQRIEKEMSDAF